MYVQLTVGYNKLSFQNVFFNTVGDCINLICMANENFHFHKHKLHEIYDANLHVCTLYNEPRKHVLVVTHCNN